MSLSVAGVWQVGVWDQTVWAENVWREGAYVATVVTTAKGGYVPPTYKKYKLRKKDESVLAEIEQLLEVVEEVSDPVIEGPKEQELKQVVEEVKQHFDFAAATRKISDRNRKMAAVKAELKDLTASVTQYAHKKEDDHRRRLLFLA